MCGKASVSSLAWKDIYAWANLLVPPDGLPEDPETRINISPSRIPRRSEPDVVTWETLPATVAQPNQDTCWSGDATWPFLPPWSGGSLPILKNGKLLSTANARLRHDDSPFAPTFMPAWKSQRRAVVWVSWFYEFDGRTHPKVPYAVFPLGLPFWPMAALASAAKDGQPPSVAIITVEPNRVLQSVGHHRSPALLQTPEEVRAWLQGPPETALSLLRPYPDEEMGVETVPMAIKIPGNQDVPLPEPLVHHPQGFRPLS